TVFFGQICIRDPYSKSAKTIVKIAPSSPIAYTFFVDVIQCACGYQPLKHRTENLAAAGFFVFIPLQINVIFRAVSPG
ncbi:hypothetical protein ACYHJB_005825, partial [Klebsiella michiganensis]